jgi:hypothetical protein
MVSVSVFSNNLARAYAPASYADDARVDATPHVVTGGDNSGLTMRVLRRTGLRPLAVQSREIASAMSFQPGGAPFWYEVNLHQTASGTYLIDIRRFEKSETATDFFRVIEVVDMDAVIETLETFDPAGDIVPKMDLGASRATIELAIEAASLKLLMLESRRQFQELVGEILHGLDA